MGVSVDVFFWRGGSRPTHFEVLPKSDESAWTDIDRGKQVELEGQ
jgi:hypothetical protein